MHTMWLNYACTFKNKTTVTVDPVNMRIIDHPKLTLTSQNNVHLPGQ